MELARDLNPPQRPHSCGNPSPVNVKLKVSASYVSRERAGEAYSFPVVFKTRATDSDRKSGKHKCEESSLSPPA